MDELTVPALPFLPRQRLRPRLLVRSPQRRSHLRLRLRLLQLLSLLQLLRTHLTQHQRLLHIFLQRQMPHARLLQLHFLAQRQAFQRRQSHRRIQGLLLSQLRSRFLLHLLQLWILQLQSRLILQRPLLQLRPCRLLLRPLLQLHLQRQAFQLHRFHQRVQGVLPQLRS